MVRKRVPVERMIEEDAISASKALGISVEMLKETKVSLYDILVVRYDKEVENAFSSAGSVFRAATFYVIKCLLKQLNLLPKETEE